MTEIKIGKPISFIILMSSLTSINKPLKLSDAKNFLLKKVTKNE